MKQPSIDIQSELEATIVPIVVPLEKKELQDFFKRGSIPAGPNAAAKINPEGFSIEFENSTSIQLIKRGPILRPAVFQTIKLQNIGAATAEDAMIEFRIPNLPTNNNSFYGRWVTPDSPQHYNLLPGQSHEVSFSKIYIYIITKFSPGMGIVNVYQYPHDDLSRSHFAYNPSINPEYGPTGSLQYLPSILSEDIDPRFYVPKKEGDNSETLVKSEQWNGREIYLQSEQADRQYTVQARVLANNYRSPWYEIGNIRIPTGPIIKSLNDENWHEVWDRPIYKELTDDIKESIRRWRSEGSEIYRYARI